MVVPAKIQCNSKFMHYYVMHYEKVYCTTVSYSTGSQTPNPQVTPSTLYSTLASSLILPALDHQQISVLKARWRKIAVGLGRK